MNANKEVLTELFKTFNNEIVKAEQTGKVTKTLSNIYSTLFSSIEDLARQRNQNLIVIRANRAKDIALNIRQDNTIETSEIILRKQAVVFLVSSFETYLTNIFCHLIEYNYESVIQSTKFPENIKIEKITLQEIGSECVSRLLGKILISSSGGDINFQDLKSTFTAFSDLLNVDIGSSISQDEKDFIIRFQAMRHIFVHKDGIIDEKFIKQIRDTRYSSDYTLNNAFEMSETLFDETIEQITTVSKKFLECIMSLC